MTYIHKKEAKEEQGCLGVFLGEQQSTEEAEYLFIRGILEVPPENENGETDWNTLREQQQKFFPEWTVQGCCVIGTYPAGRMEKLAEAVPESTGLLYHLQEQEETLYWMADGQYNRLPGYFVFYEQNRKMQEYLSALYGEESVEKESLPDKAIRSFRAKVEEKGTQKNSSFLRLASSFFVITVLVIGAIAVNRLDDIRKVRKTADITVAEDKVAAGQAAARIKASGDGGSTAVSSGGAAPDAQQEVEANAVDDAVLAGSDSFWEDTTAELNELMNSAPGENYGDDGAASQAADGGTQQSADDQGVQNVSSQSVDAASQGADGQSADAASQSAGSQAVDAASQSADGQSADAASQGADSQAANASLQNADNLTANASSQGTNDQAAAAASQSTGNPASQGAGNQSADAASQSADSQAANAALQNANDLAVDAASQNADSQSANASSQGTNDQAAASQNANNPASQGTSAQDGVTVGTVTTTNGGEPDGTQEAVSRQIQATYTIREGDTLADICNKYYGGLDRLQELCDVNAITDANLIMPGQKLVLP